MKAERHKKIINFLKNAGSAKVSVLSKELNVTKETIRADLNSLAKKGIVSRCHGGAFIEFESLDKVAKKEIIQFLECNDSLNEITNKDDSVNGKVCVLGSFNVDMISYLPRLPEAGESLLSNKFIFSPGGKGCNQALAASYSDSQVHFITKIGTDQFSDYAVNFISSSKIKTSTIYQTEKFQTGTASIFFSENSGENIISIYPGSNMDISSDEVKIQKDKIINSNIILLQLETNIEALREIISIGNEYNIPIILNPAPYSDIAIELLEKVDILTPNETEASLLSGVNVVDMESAKKAAEIIHTKGVKKVVITLGSKGSIAYDGNKFIYSPAYTAVVKNTAGAGDAFNGALAASLAKGKQFSYALRYASAFSSLAVETSNASEMPEDINVMYRINQTTYSQVVTQSPE
ncbi:MULTISPECIES: PfkB family carbohydrate kinase [unclassified Providencia]|uniref:PfkB family carbohydrate kinase n=1 Tax=unclassified Providencia TaxID=2633465 RepID=UPI00234BCD9D|nr:MULTISPECIES: PfkB family carbohydrate kinase [unclassified Providencia]